ncbi:DUF4199 family protein [Aquimarina sp. AU58]|uniref:DUF4199 family protein n=1 Tax=Aquimarina sp. AU58 TaxID=1874112 RepID=UPI000D6E5208|nr:DUF4199 family protein [Aquimarina sp. AU58]
METNDISAKKHIIKYGVILGFIWAIYGVIRYLTDNVNTSNWKLSLFELSIHIGIIILAIYVYKSSNNGFLKLNEAIKIGVGIALIGAIIAIIWRIILMNVIEPEMMTEILDTNRKKMIDQNPDMSPEEIHETMISAKKINSIYITSALVLIWSILEAFVISLVGGAIMHKKQNL